MWGTAAWRHACSLSSERFTRSENLACGISSDLLSTFGFEPIHPSPQRTPLHTHTLQFNSHFIANIPLYNTCIRHTKRLCLTGELSCGCCQSFMLHCVADIVINGCTQPATSTLYCRCEHTFSTNLLHSCLWSPQQKLCLQPQTGLQTSLEIIQRARAALTTHRLNVKGQSM